MDLLRRLWRWCDHHATALAAAVVVLGVVASFAASGYADHLGRRQEQQVLDRRADVAAWALQREVARYRDAVDALAASVSAQQDFDAADFTALTAPLLRAHLGGASSAAFIAPATADQVPAVEAFWSPRGGPRLVPSGYGEHMFIVFSTALDGGTTSARGRDLATTPQPLSALQQARSTGATTVSDTYVFLRDLDLPPDRRQPSIVIVAPVHGAAGTSAAAQFRGWVVLGLRTGDVARQVLTDTGQGLTNATVDITDSTGATVHAARVVAGTPSSPARSARVVLPVADQLWTLTVASTTRGDQLAASYHHLGQVLLFGGSTLSALLAVAGWLLGSGRRRAQAQVLTATADLRAAEAAARRQAGLMDAIVDSIGDGVVVVDRRGDFVLRNRAAQALLGNDEDTSHTTGWSRHHQMFQADGQTPFPFGRLPLVRAIHGESTDDVDMVIRHSGRPDGVTITVTGRPLDEAAGVVGGAVAVFHDVTEQRRTQQELARSEAAHQAAFDDALVGMSVLSLDGRFLRVNSAFAVMLGRTPADLVGTPAAAVNHPDEDPRGTQDLVRAALAGERDSFRLRRRFVRADATTGHADLHAVLVRDADGAPLHFANQVVDVSERVSAELERDAQQQMLRAVMDNSQSIIYVKDLRGRYLLANAVLQQRFGRTEAEVVGRTDGELHRAPDPAWAERDVQARHGVVRDEDLIARPDGSVSVYDSVRFPLHDAGGVLYGTCGISTDVTARHQASAQKEAAAQAVAAAALEATEAKSRFLSTMSHEIRTPLNGVLGLVALLQDTHLDPQQEAWARAADSSGRALLAIVNDVLDSAKIEAGAVTLESLELSLLDVVADATAPLLPEADAKGLSVVVVPARGFNAHRIGDPTRLRQLVTNLVANAVKFTHQGTVTVMLSGTDLRVRISVSDTGIGMTDVEQQRLFAPFTQATTSTTRQFGGTGLGLSIVRGLVEAMDGDVAVTSAPGLGTSFHLDLPLLAVAAARPPRLPSPRAGDRRTARVRPMRLLVAEDNEVNQVVARATLEGHGMQVDVVPDGAAAVDAVLTGHYAAVFMDCQMPGVDGLEATRRIRALEASGVTGTRRLPVVAMTAGAFATDRTACRDAGMDAFLPKPWTAEQLLATLTEVSAARADAQDAAAPEVDHVLARLDELFEDTDPVVARPVRDRLVDSYLERTPALLAALASAAATGDTAALTRTAHVLRGMTGNLGASRMAALSAALEEGTAGADVLVTHLVAAHDQLAAQLRDAVSQR